MAPADWVRSKERGGGGGGGGEKWREQGEEWIHVTSEKKGET